MLQPWAPLEEGVRALDDELAYDDPGRAYERIGPIGTRQLVYYRTGPGHPWTVVVIVPFESVLSLATEVTGPLTIFLGASGLALALTLALLIRQVNQPLSALSKAAGAMAHRDLDTPVQIGGEDEVGRLGRSFEQMRRSLRGRLNELQLLLGVSQSVKIASIPDPDEGEITYLFFTITRKSGEFQTWHRMNLGFLKDLRKQLLIWRLVTPEAKQRLTKEGAELIEEKVKASG